MLCHLVVISSERAEHSLKVTHPSCGTPFGVIVWKKVESNASLRVFGYTLDLLAVRTPVSCALKFVCTLHEPILIDISCTIPNVKVGIDNTHAHKKLCLCFECFQSYQRSEQQFAPAIYN